MRYGLLAIMVIACVCVLTAMSMARDTTVNSHTSEAAAMSTKGYFESMIKRTLDEAYLPYTQNMVNQILGTAAVETDFFSVLHQVNGPALGYFQCEPATRKDIIDNYLKYNPRLRKRIEDAFGSLEVSDEFFTINIPLQIIFCYLHYNRYGAWGRDIYGYAAAWKRIYNTYKGKGTVEDFIVKYHRYVEA